MADPADAPPQPPLWTWAAAAGVAAAILAGLVLLDRALAPGQRAASFNITRLADAAEGPRTIVIIGTSKTRCAIETDPVFTSRLRRLGADLRLVRVVQDGAAAEDLPEVFDAVVRLKPRLVLLETDMIVYETFVFRGDMPARPGWRQSLRNTLRGLPRLDRRGDDNRADGFDRACDYGTSRIADMDAYVAKRMRILALRTASSAADRAPYLAFLRTLRAQGTETALLRLPPRPDAAGQLPAKLLRDANAVRAALARDEGLAELRVATPVTPADYHDAGHMTPEGRRRASAWLAAHLATRLAGQPGA